MNLLSVVLLMVVTEVSFGQGKFDVKIILNKNINVKKLIVSVDNGKTEYLPKLESTSSGIRIRGEYFGAYAEVLVKYPKENSSNFFMLSTFFVGQEPATIHFRFTRDRDSILNHYLLRSTKDFKEEKLKMNQYDSAAKEKANAFVRKYGNKTFSDTTLFRQFLKLDEEIYDKDLEFILNNKDSYYAFSFFRRNFVNSKRLSSDSILSILGSFPDKFKNSEEAESIRNLINGLELVKLNGKAPDFSSKDINGRKVLLSNHTRKGYVLLNFWATWCGPCLEEMPALKSLYERYRDKNLMIISIAYSSNQSDFQKDIKKYQMAWINIYNDVDLINSYGGEKPIPRLYLIDKKGMIIYAKDVDSPDIELERLKKVLSNSLGIDKAIRR